MTTRTGLLPGSSPERKPAPDLSFSLPLAWRIGLSGLLLVHLAAVFLPPFQFASRAGDGSSSPFANWLTEWVRPYADALYMNHGYAFFAPNPGASHLVAYKVEFADGREPVTGRFPNLKEQQPRLKYHRHFMIAEALNNQFEWPVQPPKPSPPALNGPTVKNAKLIYQDQLQQYEAAVKIWEHRRRQYEAMQKSLEQHLVQTHGGSKATLTRVEHQLLSPFQVRELEMRADDASTYVNLPEAAPTLLPMDPSGANR
jgi:hypothetical protein